MNRKSLIILLLIPVFGTSQVVSDAKLWTGVSVNKKVNDFEFSFTEEVRLDENISHIDAFFGELGVKYKIVKGLYVALNYRFGRDNDYETRNYDIKHRVDFGLAYKYKLNKFRFSFRTKFQRKSASPEDNSPTYSRNKFAIKYKFNKKFTPYVAYEFYYQFNDQNIINRTRIALGTNYKINDNNSLKFFYMYENRFNTKNLKHNHIYGVYYTIDI